jgi:N-acetylglucosaminyldiphosphoundecaprenol N-acetyl-beta-D-mannosaminyltransferase
MESVHIPKFEVCGVNVHAVQPEGAKRIILSWFDAPRSFHYLSSTNLNNLAHAVESSNFKVVTNTAALSIPDGVPLLWYGRLKGFHLPKRCGIEEVMEAIFGLSNEGYPFRHYFYGNTEDVLKRMENVLKQRYPRLQIAGMYAPPFRELNDEEKQDVIHMINAAKPDFLWVSLGCPKQEIWLYEHRDKLDVVVGGGAGAVFNFISGDTAAAPQWVKYAGLEWLMRLLMEPRRLYKRYLIRYPRFITAFLRHHLRWRQG